MEKLRDLIKNEKYAPVTKVYANSWRGFITSGTLLNAKELMGIDRGNFKLTNNVLKPIIMFFF